MGVRETSLSAYDRVELQRREREVMTACWRHFPPPATFTRKELAQAMGWEINRITGRVLTLIERGFLLELKERRDDAFLLTINDSSKPLRLTRPKAPAPAPALTGESAPSAASVATDMRGPSFPPFNAPPAAEALIHTWNAQGKPFSYVAVGYGPGWPEDQDHLHKRRAG